MFNSSFSCIPCLVAFSTRSEQAEHLKTSFHTYNLRRRANGQQPLTPSEFAERKELIDQFINEGTTSKTGSHKTGKTRKRDRHLHKKVRSVCASQLLPDKTSQEPSDDKAQSVKDDEIDVVAPRVEPPIVYTSAMSLFDEHVAESFTENCAYMKDRFSLYFADDDYLTDKEAFVTYLGQKVYEGHQCLHCNKPFPSRRAVMQHMNDCGHRHIGRHLEEHKTEYEDFYDYSTSYKELRIPAELVSTIQNAIDTDKLALAAVCESNADGQDKYNDDDDDEWEVLSEYECTDPADAPGFALISEIKSSEIGGRGTNEVGFDVREYFRKLGIEVVRLTAENDLVLPMSTKQVYNRKNLLQNKKPAVGKRGSHREAVVALKDSAGNENRQEDKVRIIRRSMRGERAKRARKDVRLGVKGNSLGRYIARKNKIFI